jgi:hypothetical protein
MRYAGNDIIEKCGALTDWYRPNQALDKSWAPARKIISDAVDTERGGQRTRRAPDVPLLSTVRYTSNKRGSVGRR